MMEAVSTESPKSSSSRVEVSSGVMASRMLRVVRVTVRHRTGVRDGNGGRLKQPSERTDGWSGQG